jgi:hypothetical protein
MTKRDRPGSEKKSNKRAKVETVVDEATETSQAVKDESKTADNATTIKSKKASKSATGRKNVFLKKKIDVAVSLLPGSLRNCEASVEDSISQLLLKYSDGLGGILMACDNVKLKSDETGQGRGWILNELPYIHYTASCDALVFRPQVGCEVRSKRKVKSKKKYAPALIQARSLLVASWGSQ